MGPEDFDAEDDDTFICRHTSQPCTPSDPSWSCEDMGCWKEHGSDETDGL